MAINEQFQKFYENIKLTEAQREDAKRKYDGVCSKLHSYYYPDTTYDGTTRFLIGSYGKRTHIRPARDIDVIFIMPPEKFSQYADNSSNCQSQLLQDIKTILEEKYPDTPISAWGKVVALDFADPQHKVEVQPAWENENGTFTIPNSENGGSWETVDPRAEIKRIKESDDQTGKTRALIRMIKKWSELCTANVKSYAIENKVIEFFSINSAGEYAATVRDFFAYFYNSETDENLRSHLNTASNRARKACDFEGEQKIDHATEEWRKIFGDNFPVATEKIAVVKETIPALADSSHCEVLRWPFVAERRVNINAYTYNPEKTVKLGGLNSNGRSLATGLSLKYVAETNAGGQFEYYWQVVNTGEHARSLGGLRGSIFPGKKIQWESTLYRGKHWIECFIIQSGQCVARSGKFFVNIK